MVHWEDYPIKEESWEPASIMRKYVPQKVAEFHQKNPLTPRPLTKIQYTQLQFKPMPEALTEMDISHPDGIFLQYFPRSANLERGVMSESVIS